MPAKFGTFGINPIYNGEYKIGKVYRGIDLVFSSGGPASSIDDNKLIKSPLYTYSSSTYKTYQAATDTAAVDGTTYFKWDIPSQSFVKLNLSVGDVVPTNSYKYTTNATNAASTPIEGYVAVIGFTETLNIPEDFVLNGDDLGYYNGVKNNLSSLDLSSFNTDNVKKISYYNFPESWLFDTKYEYTSLKNVSDILFSDAYASISLSNIGVAIGSNLSDGTNVTIKSNSITKLPNGMLGSGFAGQYSWRDDLGGGIYKLKSLVIDMPNLVEIGANSIVVPYANMNTTGTPHVYIPQSVKSIGPENSGLYYCSSPDDDLFKIAIKNTNNIFVASNLNSWEYADKTFDFSNPNIIGLAGVSYVDTYDHPYSLTITIPDNVKYVSPGCVNPHSSNSKVYLNSNLEWYPALCTLSTSGTSSIFSDSSLQIASASFGSNVNFVPPKFFYNSSSSFSGGITFNAPANTNITIGSNAFYYKSSRSVKIYYNAPNASITDYNWSSNQNLTVTFVEL